MPAAPRIAILLTAGLLAGPFSAGPFSAGQALAETSAAPQGPLCSASVLTALTAWDAGLSTAAKFGDKAVAVAREKGRDYLLPLLGLDPKAATPQGSAPADSGVGAIERLLEASRQDPAGRQDLCIAITQAVEEARGTAGAGLDALQRALDSLRLPDHVPGPQPAPVPAPSRDDGLIRI